jgi:hypothetical protein
MTAFYTRIKALSPRNQRLFAIERAESVLPIWEGHHPDDLRPRRAIEAAKAYLAGEVTQEALLVAREAAHLATGAGVEAARSAAYAAGAACGDYGAISAAICADAAEEAWWAARLAEYEGNQL